MAATGRDLRRLRHLPELDRARDSCHRSSAARIADDGLKPRFTGAVATALPIGPRRSNTVATPGSGARMTVMGHAASPTYARPAGC